MCIHRSCYCSIFQFTFQTEKGSRCWKRNGGYKMCIHRSCLWSSYRFTFETERKVTSVVRGTVYTKCVYILPFSGVSADLTSRKIKGYWCWKRNGVYKMCIHRSCFWSTCRFTIETEKNVNGVVRGTLYTKCV